MPSLSRRQLLAAGLGVGAALGVASSPGTASGAPGPIGVSRPDIHPRDDWARGLDPTGPLQEEAPGDVRFLVIHHSESPNSETPESIPGRLRGFFNFHTGTNKWPDVAYNFFVDPFGRIWEGRRGSLAGPVRGDATGGSQGYAQLACFVGDHTSRPPTDSALGAMAELVAWLAGRYAIDLEGERPIRFTSRGSNRWPAGVEVTTDPVVGHRDMSQTSCPGDALYPLVRSRILPDARQLFRAFRAPVPTGTPTEGAPIGPNSEESATTTPSVTPSPSPEGSADTPIPAPDIGTEQPGLPAGVLPLGIGAAALVGAGAIAAAVAKKRTP